MRVKGIAYLNEALATISRWVKISKFLVSLFPTDGSTPDSAGEIKIWTCNTEEKKLKQIACGNIDCRPTCMGLLDTKQFGKPKQTQSNADIAKQQVQKPQQSEASNQDDARTFVSIEYEADAKEAAGKASYDSAESSHESDDSDNAKKVPSKSKSKLKPKSKSDAAPDSSSEDDFDSDDSDTESQSDSESDSERRPRPKTIANKRKAIVNNKSRAKQAKNQ